TCALPISRPVHGPAPGLRPAATRAARPRRLPAHPLAAQRLAEQAVRAVLSRPGRTPAAARSRATGLVRAGSRRLATPGPGAQPGAGAQPVPPAPGAVAGAGPGPLPGGKRLSRATGPVLRIPAHTPQSAAARRTRGCPQKLWI